MKELPPALCSVSFSDPEGYIDSGDYPPLPLSNFLECTYNVTVYTGYGVELQVTADRGPAEAASPSRKSPEDCLTWLTVIVLTGLVLSLPSSGQFEPGFGE